MNLSRIRLLRESSLFHLWSAGWRQCIGFYRRLFGQSFAFINAINGSLRPPQPEGWKNHGRAISNWFLQFCWKLGTWSQWEALGRNRNHTKWGSDIMVNTKKERNIVLSVSICACVSVFLGICSCAFVCLCVWVSQYLSVSVCLSICLFENLYLCVFEYLCIYVCLRICVSLCVWESVYLCVEEVRVGDRKATSVPQGRPTGHGVSLAK